MKLEIFKNAFFLSSTILHLSDIQSFVYLTKIDIFNIIKKEIKLAILKLILDKILNTNNIPNRVL